MSLVADVEAVADGAASAQRLVVAFRPRAGMLRDLLLYGLGSALALAVDWAALTLLCRRGTPALAAAAIGFLLGMTVSYLFSVRLVYADRRRGTRRREVATFFAIGLAGLGLNEMSLFAFAALLEVSAPIAKAPTAGLVFLFNFALRRAMVFSPADP